MKNIFFSILFLLHSLLIGCISNSNKNVLCDEPKYNNIFKAPRDLKAYFDYEQGLKCAKEKNKPVLLAFTAWGAISDRILSFEKRVENDSIYEIINNDFLLIVLYIDDQTKLPENEKYVSKNDDGDVLINTIGQKNMMIEINKYNIFTAPLYCILTSEGKLVSKSAEIGSDKPFLEFLKNGLSLTGN